MQRITVSSCILKGVILIELNVTVMGLHGKVLVAGGGGAIGVASERSIPHA